MHFRRSRRASNGVYAERGARSCPSSTLCRTSDDIYTISYPLHNCQLRERTVLNAAQDSLEQQLFLLAAGLVVQALESQ